MPKYYVSCGDVRQIVVCNDSWTAACTAFLRSFEHDQPEVEHVVCVSERGYDGLFLERDEDEFFFAPAVADAIDLEIEDYHTAGTISKPELIDYAYEND